MVGGATRITLPGNAQASQTYANGMLTQSLDFGASAPTTISSRDGYKRVTGVSVPNEGETTISYATAGTDAAEFVRSATPKGGVTKETFDQYRQRSSRDLPNQPSEQFAYRSTGELSTRRGGALPPMAFAYDGASDLTALDLFNNFDATATPATGAGFSTSSGGNPLTPPTSGGFDGPSSTTRWEYDAARGWPAAKLFADGTRHTLGRDLSGLLTNRTGGRGIVTAYGRDGVGRVRTLNYSDGTPAVTNGYDPRNLPVLVMDAGGTRASAWDLAGRPLAVTQTLPFGPGSAALTYGYTTNTDQCGGYTLAIGGMTNVAQVVYAYGDNGRLGTVAVVTPGGPTNTFTYAWRPDDAKLAAIAFPNGVTNTYVYETNSPALASIRIWPKLAAGGQGTTLTPVLQYDYLYDLALRCTNFARPYEARATQYAYTNGRLAAASACVSGTVRSARWFYDTAGNCILASNAFAGAATVTARTYNNLNQIRPTPTTAASFFDADGNMVTNAGWEYSWDAENRLTGISNATTRVVNTFDSQHRRVRKQVYTAGTLVSDATYIYDGWNLIAETVNREPGTTSTNLYIWGVDRDGSHASDSGGVRGLLAIIRDTNVYYPVMNNHGDVMALMDASGSNIVARYEYDPWGTLLSASGPAADACPFRWQTKYCDNETGLYYFGYRFYDSTTGRWLSRDPLQEEGGVNLYEVCGNNPVDNFDPLGLTDQNAVALNLSYVGIYGSKVTLDFRYRSATAYSTPYAKHEHVTTIPRPPPPELHRPPAYRATTSQAAQRQPCPELEVSRGPDYDARSLEHVNSLVPSGMIGTPMGDQYMQMQGDLFLGALAEPAIARILAKLGQGFRIARLMGGAERMSLTEARVIVSTRPFRWTPLNGSGPLGEDMAKTFRSATYTEFIADEPITLYRTWGGRSKELGPFWTRTKPAGTLQTQLDGAVLPEFGNTFENVTTIRVPAGTRLFEGVAAPQNRTIIDLIGGGNQVVVPHIKPSWIVQ
jgi:RHS repeat-associated protein